MAQRREYIPTDVKQHIFKFIHEEVDEDEESYRRKRKRNMRSVWTNMNISLT